jgi:hypothetical protein
MKALATAIDGAHVGMKLDMRQEGKLWNTFVQRFPHLGCMLPGTVTQLGQSGLSWVIKWPEDGIKDSHVFPIYNMMTDLELWTKYPPDLNLDSTLDEVTVVLRTGIRYILGHDDLEMIICMAPGKYSLADTVARGQIHDLEIGDVVVNSTLCEAIFRLNSIIAEYNSSLPAPRPHSFVLTRLAFLREKPPITPFKEIKGSGRLTWHRARLGDQTLAVA